MTPLFHTLRNTALLTTVALILSACNSGSTETSPPPASTPAPQTASAPTQEVSADVVLKRGKRMFIRCRSCHTLDADGKNGTGPNLRGIIGAKAGQKEDFSYSKALQNADIVWDDESLDAFIEKPNKFLSGTSMAFAGIKKAEDRTALMAYLKDATK